jgi:tetratricopeptide (TPR) repeat protein
MRISFVLVLAVACGGPAEGPKTPGSGGGGGAGGTKPAAAGDVSIEIPSVEIKGVVFEPEALGMPGMPLYEPKRKITIEKQRDVFGKTKDPVQKEAQAAILATLLYQKSKDAKDDEQKALRLEARQVLRDAAAASGDKVDEVTLRLLGSYELMHEDFAAAEQAWGALVVKVPKDKDALINKAWWAYALLKTSKNADALAAIKDEPLSEKVPELAYVAAWAKWRTGDDAGAWQAILTAAKGWKDMPGRAEIDRDLLLFAGRTNVPVADGFTQLTTVYSKVKDPYGLYVKLGTQSYQYAGRWADGVAAIEKALEVGADKVPVDDRPTLRYLEADYTTRLDDPVAAAKHAKEALEALPKCGAKCSPKDMEQIVVNIYGMGRLFHVLYATANDVRYYEPAHDLYQAAIPLITQSDATRTEATKDADVLERTFKAMKHDTGTHDKDAIKALLQRHNQEVQACYEQWLSANPKLAGNIVLNLEVDQIGTIKGQSTEPKAGLAGCIGEHAKAWRLPKRGSAGSTRIKITYVTGPRAKETK